MDSASTRALLAVSLLALTCPAQTAVSGGGSALADAFNAASDGDVLVVAPGTYDGFTSLGVTNVTVVAPQRATVQGGITILLFAGMTGTLRFRGLDVAGGLTAADVVIDDCTFGGPMNVRSGAITRTTVQVTSFGNALTFGPGSLAISDSWFESPNSNGITNGLSGIVGNSTLRAERITCIGGTTNSGMFLTGGLATIADSTILPGPAGPLSIDGFGMTVVQLEDTATPGGVSPGAADPQPLATAELLGDGWDVGVETDFMITAEPNMPVCAIVTWGPVVPVDIPALAAQPLFVLGAPFVELALGLTDGDGELPISVTLPPGVGFEYTPTWVVGIAMSTTLVQSTVPVGGIVN